MHTPALARGFSLFDSFETHWKNGLCPYRKTDPDVIERTDEGAVFYKKFFYAKGNILIVKQLDASDAI